MPHTLPKFFRELDLDASGLTANELDAASAQELETLIDEAMATAEMNFGCMTWVTESTDELETAQSQPVTLMERLGIPWLRDRLAKEEKACVRFDYPRASLPEGTTLHVPTSLDGIASVPFRPNPDCSAPYGLTQPLAPGPEAGFPESVHGACKVAEFQITLVVP